ncbi:MAG TPA: hypothetical protein PL009_11850 [Flavipsychrobacter sp.]|nr:hypothetical protein [Flavipsychrobacter sp.]
MKQLAAILFLLFPTVAIAQQYRLTYDVSTIPELYLQTTISLEEKRGTSYERYSGKYRISSQQGSLRGLDFSYMEDDLLKTNGSFLFTVEVRGEKLQLPLKVPMLTALRFNFYTDSIKPILNYYLNVEGVFSSGKILPLSATHVTVTSDVGAVQEMEWIAPKQRNFEKVKFTAVSKSHPSIKTDAIVYLKKEVDPRDAENYNGR